MNAPEIYELHTAHCSQLQNGGAVSFGVSVKALATFVGERLSSASAQKKRSKCEAAGLRAEETHSSVGALCLRIGVPCSPSWRSVRRP